MTRPAPRTLPLPAEALRLMTIAAWALAVAVLAHAAVQAVLLVLGVSFTGNLMHGIATVGALPALAIPAAARQHMKEASR